MKNEAEEWTDTKEDSKSHKDFNGQGKIPFLAPFPTTISQKQAGIFFPPP